MSRGYVPLTAKSLRSIFASHSRGGNAVKPHWRRKDRTRTSTWTRNGASADTGGTGKLIVFPSPPSRNSNWSSRDGNRPLRSILCEGCLNYVMSLNSRLNIPLIWNIELISGVKGAPNFMPRIRPTTWSRLWFAISVTWKWDRVVGHFSFFWKLIWS